MPNSNFNSNNSSGFIDPETQNAKVADHWDGVQNQRKKLEYRYFDWGDHPTITELVYGEVFGSKGIDILDYIIQEYPDFSTKKALSLCCGPGTTEKTLIERNVFGQVTGLDIAPGLIAEANAARQPYEDRLNFTLGDVNSGQFGQDSYDVLFAKSALHHIENLEDLMRGIKACLKPGGHLVTIDFFGPTRFQWTDSQLELATNFVEEHISTELRQKADGTLYSVTRPTVDEMIRVDPSEAARSDELEGFIKSNFKNIKSFELGGTLLNLIFDTSIINNFDQHSDSHNSIIEKAFMLERGLITSGKLRSDFKLIIAEIEK